MALKIRYSLRARHEEIELLNYILEKFGQGKAREIYQRIEKVLSDLSKMPEMYPASTSLMFLANKQVSITE